MHGHQNIKINCHSKNNYHTVPFHTAAINNALFYLTHQPKHVLNKIQFMADISLLLVSAPGCHPQGLFQIKGIQASPSLE